MARTDHRKGSIGYDFIAVPKAVLALPEWQGLPHRAQALAFMVMSQYTGKNNGRLTPSFVVMNRCGWNSRDQVSKAKSELLTCSFAIETRKGRAPRTAAWIGFTWWPLNWHESMDIKPASWTLMNFISIQAARVDPNEGREKAKTRNRVCIPHGGPMEGGNALPVSRTAVR